jgi:uncharacterized damage-inducible protein DinB
MMMLDHLRMLARFNKAMNEKVYGAAQRLPEETIVADKGAFFGSIMGTLNHLLVADISWLKRFREHPAHFPALEPLDSIAWPEWYDAAMAPTIKELDEKRQQLDDMIVAWTDELKKADIEHSLAYRNMQGKQFCKPFGHLALHLFNHQIHHRGQVTTLLSQQGENVEGTGMLSFVPDITS